MTTTAASKHRERCERESTRDVIFLFQIRELTWTGNLPSDYEIDEDSNVWEDGVDRDTGNPTTLAQLYRDHGSEYAVESWRTVGVWLDRDEAELWARSQRHNYGDKFDGTSAMHRCWRVYGVPAEGELANLIRVTG